MTTTAEGKGTRTRSGTASLKVAPDYRVTLRHIPFRTKSRAVEAASPDEAWAEYLKLLQTEHQNLTPAQKKTIGRQQAEWLADRIAHPAERPPHLEILLEEEHQERILANQRREEENRKLIEEGQKRQIAAATQQAEAFAILAETQKKMLEVLIRMEHREQQQQQNKKN